MFRTATLVFLVLLSATPVSVASENRGRIGFWQIVKDDTQVWWFQNPQGQRVFLNSVTTVIPHLESREGKGFQSKDYQGNDREWAKKTATRLADYGFESVAAWSHPAMREFYPYSVDLNISLWLDSKIGSAEWVAGVDEVVRKQVEKTKEDRNLIGYYLDNELDWDELAPHADIYFKTTYAAIKKHDPNHLILGVRFHKLMPVSVLKASQGFVDAHSINVYSDDAKLWRKYAKDIYENSKSPILVSEFSFYSHDNRSGNKNAKGWGGLVADQQARAKSYSFFVEGLAETSFFIGTAWFQLMDEPAGGRVKDGEDMNVGVVDVEDRAYGPLVAAMRFSNKKADEIHLNSNDKQLGEVWREGRYHVPFEAKNKTAAAITSP